MTTCVPPSVVQAVCSAPSDQEVLLAARSAVPIHKQPLAKAQDALELASATHPTPMGLVIQIASLRRAAQAAQGCKPQDTSAPPSPSENTCSPRPCASWNNLLSDLKTRLRRIMGMPAFADEQLGRTSDTTKHLSSDAGTEDTKEPPEADDIHSPSLHAHFPKAQWADRYPGAAGDWLSAELAMRKEQATAPIPKKPDASYKDPVLRDLADSPGPIPCALIVPTESVPAPVHGGHSPPPARINFALVQQPPHEPSSSQSSSCPTTPCEASGSDTIKPADMRMATQASHHRLHSALSALCVPEARCSASSQLPGMVDDFYNWRASRQTNEPKTPPHRASPPRAPDSEVVQNVMDQAEQEKVEPTKSRRIDAEMAIPVHFSEATDLPARPQEAVPLLDWIDFQATARAIASLSHGTHSETKTLGKLVPVASVRQSSDTQVFPLHMLPYDSHACTLDAHELPESDYVTSRPANVLHDDTTTLTASADDVVLFQVRSTLQRDALGTLPLAHLSLPSDDKLRTSIAAWERLLDAPASWLPLSAYKAEHGSNADTIDTRVLRHLTRHEALYARRLTHVAYTAKQLAAVEECTESTARSSHTKPIVDRLVTERMNAYISQLHSHMDRVDKYEPLFVLSQLRLRTSPGIYGTGAHGLVFVSHTEIHAEALRAYDGMTREDVQRFARRWCLRGPGLSSSNESSDTKKDMPSLVPVAHFSLDANCDQELRLDFGVAQNADGITRYGGVSCRFLAIKLLDSSSPLSIRRVQALGYSGLRTHGQGAWFEPL